MKIKGKDKEGSVPVTQLQATMKKELLIIRALLSEAEAYKLYLKEGIGKSKQLKMEDNGSSFFAKEHNN
jgi:hypothetical protein